MRANDERIANITYTFPDGLVVSCAYGTNAYTTDNTVEVATWRESSTVVGYTSEPAFDTDERGGAND